MVLATWVALAMLAVLCYVWFGGEKRHLQRQKNADIKLPPTPFGFPIIGHLLLTLPMDLKRLTLLSQHLGSIFILRYFSTNIVYLNTSAVIREALVNNADSFGLKLQMADRWSNEISRTGFLYNDGPVQKEKRRFTLQHLRNFGFGKTAMEYIIMSEFSRICTLFDKHDGKKIQIKNFAFMSLLNVIWGIVAGKTYEHDERFLKIGNAILNKFVFAQQCIIVVAIPLLKYMRGDPWNYWALRKCTELTHDFIRKEIDEHLETFQEGQPRDYIDAYLMEIKKREGTVLTDGNECFTIRHLCGNVDEILNAAIETTTGTLEWALLYMAVWPEIQEKVQQELDEVIGRNRRPCYSDMAQLPYTKATVLEIQRYASVVGLSSVRLTKQTSSLMNYTIPKGSYVVQNLYAAHRDKKTWGDPEIFRPERFINGDNKTETPDSWMPYSVGPRNCLGESLVRMQLFLFISAILQRYSLSCVTGEPMPSLEPVVGLTLEPRPFELIVKIRSQL